jgi:glycosyltransferase involved in cell wall biosynthesis
MQTLYLCYFGLREPLVQTQVLPYLRELHLRGVGVGLLTFEPGWPASWSTDERRKWETALAQDGISWRALRYHKSPSVPATIYDILLGGIVAARWSRESGASVFHGRAHMAMAMAMLAKSITGGSTIFDLRGLVADEYFEAGVWAKQGLIYRLFKKFESFAIRRADQLVVLTRKVRDLLVTQGIATARNIEIIPCCVDLSRFDLIENIQALVQNRRSRFTLIYVGSVTGLYMLEEMGRFFLALRARRPNAYFQILTVANHEKARSVLESLGIETEHFEILSASPADLPKLLSQADVGISFIKATFSKIASSPTKIPEYLAAGLPVVSSRGMGDTDEILSSDGVGCLISGFEPPNYVQLLDELDGLLADPALSDRCRASARDRFDLKQIGGVRYRRVYQRIENARNPQSAFADPSDAHDNSADVLIDREG